MAQNTTKVIPTGAWTQLTDANVTTITFQVRPTAFGVFIKGTTDATAPTNTDGAIYYPPNSGEAKVLLSDLFPGIAAVRLWALSDAPSLVMVSHA